MAEVYPSDNDILNEEVVEDTFLVGQVGDTDESIRVDLALLKAGQADIKLMFTNHLEHHRQDSIRASERLNRWLLVCIPTVVSLVIALIGAAYMIGKN